MIIRGGLQQFQRLRALLKTLLFHRWGRFLVLVSTIYLFITYLHKKHPFSTKPHILTPPIISFAVSSTAVNPSGSSISPLSELENGLLPLSASRELCSTQRWKPYPIRTKKRKVYDIFMLNDELDWLEIRLHTLAQYVDYFVVLESNVTFTGLDKPLFLKANWQRFQKWESKIIYHVLEDPPVNAPRTWDMEDFQRNAMFLQVFPGLNRGLNLEPQDEKAVQIGDVLIVSDVDEIPRPAAIVLLRNCEEQRRVTLRSNFYYYGWQWRHIGEEWPHPQATVFRGFEKGQTILPADLRNGEGGNRIRAWWDKTDIWNAGWHCSTCFETIEEVLVKMRSFSHVGLNAEEYRDKARIVDRVRKGLDLWDREGQFYERIEGNADIPEIFKEDTLRWAYMLDRDGSNAAFKDYGSGENSGG